VTETANPDHEAGLGAQPVEQISFAAPDVGLATTTDDGPAPSAPTAAQPEADEQPAPAFKTVNLADLATGVRVAYIAPKATPTTRRVTVGKPVTLFLIVAMAVAVVMFVVFIIDRALGAASVKPPVASPGPGWSGPYQTGVSNSATGQVFGDTILVGAFTGGEQTAFDLATRQVLYTINPGDNKQIAGDSTGLVTLVGHQLTVFDAKTGATTAQTLVLDSGQVLWAGRGLILTEDWDTGSLCVRSMSTPSTCLWQARETVASRENVFGDGQWVNTAHGVVDIATGQPASFGGDAGYQKTATSEAFIYYTGSAGRVFRVNDDVSSVISSTGTSTYQPWDTATDKAVSPAVVADSVVTDSASPVYMAVISFLGSGNDNDTTTAYTWATGAKLWQQQTGMMSDDWARFIDGAYLTSLPGQGNKYPSSEEQMVALDAETGAVLWSSGHFPTDFSGSVGNTIYLVNDETLVAYDAASGFTATWQSALPSMTSAWCVPQVAGQYVFCYWTGGEFYFLDS